MFEDPLEDPQVSANTFAHATCSQTGLRRGSCGRHGTSLAENQASRYLLIGNITVLPIPQSPRLLALKSCP